MFHYPRSVAHTLSPVKERLFSLHKISQPTFNLGAARVGEPAGAARLCARDLIANARAWARSGRALCLNFGESKTECKYRILFKGRNNVQRNT